MATMTYDDYVLEHEPQLRTAFKMHKLTGQYRTESEFYQQRYKEYVRDAIEHDTHDNDCPLL